jgi:hypothetical protein
MCRPSRAASNTIVPSSSSTWSTSRMASRPLFDPDFDRRFGSSSCSGAAFRVSIGRWRDLLRYGPRESSGALLYTFDLLELNGADLLSWLGQ